MHLFCLSFFSQVVDLSDPLYLSLLIFILTESLEPTYKQLQNMKLDKSAFVIISVIGQELLARGKYVTAIQVLESALKIGTCSLKLRGSVFSALSSAYWTLNNVDKVSVETFCCKSEK